MSSPLHRIRSINAIGKAHGWGTFTYLDGHVYEGDFQNGVRHGQGTYEHWVSVIYSLLTLGRQTDRQTGRSVGYYVCYAEMWIDILDDT